MNRRANSLKSSLDEINPFLYTGVNCLTTASALCFLSLEHPRSDLDVFKEVLELDLTTFVLLTGLGLCSLVDDGDGVKLSDVLDSWGLRFDSRYKFSSAGGKEMFVSSLVEAGLHVSVAGNGTSSTEEAGATSETSSTLLCVTFGLLWGLVRGAAFDVKEIGSFFGSFFALVSLKVSSDLVSSGVSSVLISSGAASPEAVKKETGEILSSSSEIMMDPSTMVLFARVDFDLGLTNQLIREFFFGGSCFFARLLMVRTLEEIVWNRKNVSVIMQG